MSDILFKGGSWYEQPAAEKRYWSASLAEWIAMKSNPPSKLVPTGHDNALPGLTVDDNPEEAILTAR